MTTYTHIENNSVKNYGEVLREFNYLRRTDDEFARDYRSTEVGRYIMDNYTASEETTLMQAVKKYCNNNQRSDDFYMHTDENTFPPASSEEQIGTIISNAPESMDDFIESPTRFDLDKSTGTPILTNFKSPLFKGGPNEIDTQIRKYVFTQKYRTDNFEGWVERLDNILLGLETHSPSINQVSIDDLANLIAEMKNNKQ